MTQHRPLLTEKGHKQQTGQEKGWVEIKGKGWQPYSQYQLSFSQERSSCHKPRTVPEKPCLLCLTITARKGNHILLWKFRSFQGILFLHKVTITGFDLNTDREKQVWQTSLVQLQITVAFIFVLIYMLQHYYKTEWPDVLGCVLCDLEVWMKFGQNIRYGVGGHLAYRT